MGNSWILLVIDANFSIKISRSFLQPTGKNSISLFWSFCVTKIWWRYCFFAAWIRWSVNFFDCKTRNSRVWTQKSLCERKSSQKLTLHSEKPESSGANVGLQCHGKHQELSTALVWWLSARIAVGALVICTSWACHQQIQTCHQQYLIYLKWVWRVQQEERFSTAATPWIFESCVFYSFKK